MAFSSIRLQGWPTGRTPLLQPDTNPFMRLPATRRPGPAAHPLSAVMLACASLPAWAQAPAASDLGNVTISTGSRGKQIAVTSSP